MNASQWIELAINLPLQIAFLIFAAAWLDRRVQGSRTSCRLWSACFVGVLAVTAAALTLPHFRFVGLPETLPRDTIKFLLSWQTMIAASIAVVWAIGAAVVLTLRAMRWWSLRRFIANHCRAMTTAEMEKLPIAPEIKRATIRWLVSDAEHSPFCWHWHRATIVLPQSLVGGSPVTLRFVLLHELEHLRTNHSLEYFVQRVCGALFWFHPSVRWASRRAELSREYVCDEHAAAHGHSTAEYLRTLATIAEQCIAAPDCTLAFGRRPSAMIRRSDRLLANMDQPIAKTRWASAIALAVVAVALTQCWLPVHLFASTRSNVSPWPRWSASLLHNCGITVRDYEPFDPNRELRQWVSDPQP